jgi:hypothetical protein
MNKKKKIRLVASTQKSGVMLLSRSISNRSFINTIINNEYGAKIRVAKNVDTTILE